MMIKLRKKKEELIREWWVRLWLKRREEWKRSAQKLHLQFGHGSWGKLEKLDRDVYTGREDKKEEVEEFYQILTQSCRDFNICQKLKRNPRKVVVGWDCSLGIFQ